MSDEPEYEPPSVTMFFEGDERHDAFLDGLKLLIETSKDIGPVAHICLMAEVCGYIVVSQFPDQRDSMAKTMEMNMDRGIAVWIAGAMEASAMKGNLN